MENVGFYATFDKYGIEVLILAFAVCACVAAAKKLFPKMNKRTELALRFVLSVLVQKNKSQGLLAKNLKNLN